MLQERLSLLMADFLPTAEYKNMLDMIKTGIEAWELCPCESFYEKMSAYIDRMLKVNEYMNLTTITAPDEIATKHVLDSLSLIKSGFITDGIKLLDVGTGAGFPAVPLKLFNPKIDVTFLDSLRKRVNFISESLAEINSLDKTHFIHGRAEDFGAKPQYRQSFDVVVSRAVANLSLLAEMCIPFLKPDGIFIAQKGVDCEEELNGAKNAIKELGGQTLKVLDIEIPTFNQVEKVVHRLIIIKKIKNTPTKYPRLNGKIQKNPL